MGRYDGEVWWGGMVGRDEEEGCGIKVLGDRCIGGWRDGWMDDGGWVVRGGNR
jgi:hypothetical protein